MDDVGWGARRSRRCAPRPALGRGCGYSPLGDPHAGPGAVVAEQGEGYRRDARVIDVPDRGPGICRLPGGADVVRDTPEHGDVRDAPVAGEVVAQFPARFAPAERERRG